MFKQFLQRIIDAENREDAVQNVFYGTIWNPDGTIKVYGIDIAYQREKITLKEYQLLSALIDKLA